jgi:hypothetical protein
MTEPAIDTGLRARAYKLQALHIHLLFCEETRVAWRNAPADVLAAFGLPADAISLLVDPDSDQFRAEVYGRRMGVQNAVERCFATTQKYLASLRDAPRGRPPPPGFEAFLCSDAFLEPDYGLPHSSGVGVGYENVSKYFFWLRNVAGLQQPDTDLELRNTAYGEFAAWLINEYHRPHEPYYDRFKGGLYWRRAPGEALPVMLLSDKYMLFTVSDPENVRQFPDIGLIDLDDLAPPEPSQAPSLI